MTTKTYLSTAASHRLALDCDIPCLPSVLRYRAGHVTPDGKHTKPFWKHSALDPLHPTLLHRVEHAHIRHGVNSTRPGVRDADGENLGASAHDGEMPREDHDPVQDSGSPVDSPGGGGAEGTKGPCPQKQDQRGSMPEWNGNQCRRRFKPHVVSDPPCWSSTWIRWVADA